MSIITYKSQIVEIWAMLMELGLDEKRMAVWGAFVKAYTTIIPALECELRNVQGLPLIWYNVLTHLSHDSGGGLRLQELAEAIGLSQSGLTRLLDRMSEAGLVAREPCPDDRRGAYAVITPEGKAALEQATPIYRRGIEEHFLQHLRAEDIEALYEAFCRVLEGKEAMQTNFNFQRYTNIPFPERKYLPGQGIHPSKHPEGSHIPEVPSDMTKFDNDTWRNSQPYLYAIDLFNFGYWWEAHEVLEDLWIQTGRTTVIAKFIQGIIQISAALLKDSQSVSVGASRLMVRGLSKLCLRSGIFLGVNVEEFGREVERYFAGERSSPPQIILWDLKV